MGRPHGPRRQDLPRDAIIVARTMGAAELLDYDRERAARPGAGGGRRRPATSPSSPAPSASPTVGQVEERRLAVRRTATPSSSTASAGEVHLRPPADVEAAYAEKVRFRARRQEQYR